MSTHKDSAAHAHAPAPAKAHHAPGKTLGSAEMASDGTITMRLHSEVTHGAPPEQVKVVKRGDPDYAYTVRRLGGMKPGDFCSIPAFPDPATVPEAD